MSNNTKDRDFQYEIRVSGTEFMKGDAGSIGVVFGNLNGRNFMPGLGWGQTHAQWLAYMAAEYKTNLDHGANIRMFSPEGAMLDESVIGMFVEPSERPVEAVCNAGPTDDRNSTQLEERAMTMNKPVVTNLEYSKETLERNRRFGLVTRSGVVYDEELAGPRGMSFVLLREPETTDEMLQKAVAQLRRDRDVVGNIKVTAVVPHVTIKLILETSDDCEGVEYFGREGNLGKMQWDDEPDGHTTSARIERVSGASMLTRIVLTGDQWRDIESAGRFEQLIAQAFAEDSLDCFQGIQAPADRPIG